MIKERERLLKQSGFDSYVTIGAVNLLDREYKVALCCGRAYVEILNKDEADKLAGKGSFPTDNESGSFL